ncbi:MAG: ThuA domain-containing protein [Cyclobacteriaceae bacterium]
MHEANVFFAKLATENNFTYDSTRDWTKMNVDVLRGYQVVLLLDSRPESSEHRIAFQKYMEGGGACLAFHFAGFALTPSGFPMNWDWYHNQLLGSGSYGSNTWRPTSAILKVERPLHPVLKGLPEKFKSSPNEWYRWSNDLTANPDIEILLSIDASSFPLGTGPKQHEIWHWGYYPAVWANKKYKMVYFNMGHNDIDYEGHTNKDLSHTFGNTYQDQLIKQALLWVVNAKRQ